MPLHYYMQVDDEPLLRGLHGLAAMGRNPRPILGKIGYVILGGARRRLRARPKRSRGFRTYKLETSLSVRLQQYEVTVGSALPYARIQHFGGPIRPRTVKALAIPVLPHLARRNVWPRDLPRDSLKFIPPRKASRSRGVVGVLVRAQAELSEYEAKYAGGRYRQNRDASGKFTKGGQRAKGAPVQAKGEIGELMYVLVKMTYIKGRAYLLFGPTESDLSIKLIRAAQLAVWRGRQHG